MHFKKTTVSAIALLAVTILCAPAGAEVWKVDGAHTEIKFSVDHFFTPVTGRFGDFDIDLAYDEEDPSQSKVNATIKVASVDTGNSRRDKHLRSADWFDAKVYPQMSFESTSVRRVGDQLLARGDLTIKGRTHEVVLPISLLGSKDIPPEMRRMLGGVEEVASFATTAAIERADYDVGVGNWAASTVVGSEVEIEILLEAHRK